MRKTFKFLILAFSCLLIGACTNSTKAPDNTNSNQPHEEQPESTPAENDQTATEDGTAEDDNGQVNQEDEDDHEQANQEDEDDEIAQEDKSDKNEEETNDIVMENDAFIIFSPAPNATFADEIEVHGLARVFEATIQYEFEDGHFILDKGFVTASEGAPGWGEFTITIPLDDAINGEHKIILYEESAKDGSRLHELIIPVKVAK